MTEWVITSSVLIAIVAVLRFLLRGKISLKLQYALWGLVLIRLLLPFSVFESSASVLNLIREREETYTPPAVYEPYEPENITPAVPDEDVFILDEEAEHIEPEINIVVDGNGYVTEPEIRVISVKDILFPVWIGGIAVFGTIFAVSNIRFSRKLKKTRQYVSDKKAWLPVYVTPAVKTPCLFGIFKPAIYITKEVYGDEKVLRHVLEHETTHYRHGDHIWSVLRCACLAIHWYNPLVWLAAFLSMRDSELACDEATIGRIGESERIEYGRTLISLTCEKPAVGIISAATTMTGSKRSIKERIMLIAKKPKMLKITAAAVAVIAVLAVVFTFTGAENYNPKTTENPVMEQYYSQMEHSPSDYSDKTGKISMTVTSVSSDRIVTEVTNKTECVFNYSIGYRLHFEQGGKWYELPIFDEYTTDMLFFSVDSHPISSNKTSGFGNDIQESYGKLPAGKYRILRTFKCFDEPEAESFVLAAEFTVSEPKGIFDMFSKGYSEFFPGAVGTEFLNGEKPLSGLEVYVPNVDSPVWNVPFALSEEENKTLDEILDGYGFWYIKKGEKDEEKGRWLYGIDNPTIDYVQGTDVFYLGLGENMVSPGIHNIKVYENAVYLTINIASCKNPEDFSEETFDFGIDYISFVSKEKELVEKLIAFCDEKTNTEKTEENKVYWEYAPAMSSKSPWFRFEFDFDFTLINAGVYAGEGEGTLYDIESSENLNTLALENGDAIRWIPTNDGIAVVDSATLNFVVYQNDDLEKHTHTGSLEIKQISNENGKTLYEATLVSETLSLSQNVEFDGGIISVKPKEIPFPETEAMTDEEFIAAAKEMGYNDEQLETIWNLLEEGLTKSHVLHPHAMSALVPSPERTDDGKYFLGTFFFDPEIYADYGGPIGFAYIREGGNMKIIPENPSQFSDYGIIDNEHYVFGGGNEARFYEFKNPEEPYAVWKVPEQENTEFGYWGLDLAVQKNVGKAFICYIDIPDDFDKIYSNQMPDLSSTYQIAVLDSEGNLVRNIDTGINLMVEFGGLPDCVRPEIITASETSVLFKINNLHYTVDYKNGNSFAEQYIFTEKDIVKYSNIDFTGDFAQSAVAAVRDYIGENYSDNKDVLSFDILRAEIDENATYREINLAGGSVKELFDAEDVVDGFLVIRTITEIDYADGTSDSEEFKYFLLFDPENKYDRGPIIVNSGWRLIDGSKEMFDAPAFDDDRFYIYFEEGKIK